MYLSILNEHMILIEFVVIDVMQLMALTQNHFLKKYINCWIKMFKMKNIMVRKTQG
jgi:hypothetical protein